MCPIFTPTRSVRGLIFMNSSSSSNSRDTGDEDVFKDYFEMSAKYILEALRGLIFMNSSTSNIRQGISDDEDVLDYFEIKKNIICGICMEDKQRQEMFINKGNPCSHTFCIECVSRHVKAKVEGNITVITCPEPDCKSTLEPVICQGVIAEDVFEMWGTALFRSLCSGSKTVNCPFQDCSEMFVEEEGGLLITVTECPYCHRLFCAQCKVPWHSDMQCEDFLRAMKKENKLTMMQKVVSWLHGETKQSRQALDDDQVFLNLAKKNKWRKCPKCKIYVQKVEGCLHITCRCKYEFCYGCGSKWRSSHSCGI